MRTLRRTGGIALTVMVIANQLACAEEAAAAPAPAAKAEPAAVSADTAGYTLHGFLRTRYVGRKAGGAVDQDLTGTLMLDLGDQAADRVTAHLLGDVSADLNGNTSERGNYVFDSARDSSGSDIVAQVYSAYVEIHRLGALQFIRLGRQSIYETPEVSFFDGLRLETAELGAQRLRLGAYGGLPVHLYQGYTPSDAVGGAYADGHLWRGARARLDWQRLVGHVGEVEHSNSLIGAGAWQRLGQHVDLHGHYTCQDGQNRDVLARAGFNHAEWDLHAQASYFQLLRPQRGAALEADSYYPLLQERVPYEEYRGRISKGIGDHLDLAGGADLRRLTHQNQESTYNHEFDRYFATIGIYDALVKGSSLSVTEEVWISPGRRSDSQGLDVSCPIGDANRLSAGTAHYLYKYDASADLERVDVQTYYLKFDHTYSRALRFSLDYQYEDDDTSAHYHELRCEALCTF